MIFVTVGTTQYPFERLIEAMLLHAKNNPNTKYVIQSGTYKTTTTLPNVIIKQYFPYTKTQEYLKSANQIVCHAGMGTITQALHYHKKPIVVPRKGSLHEHVNEHETAIAEFLGKKHLIFVYTDPLKITFPINTTHRKSSDNTQLKKFASVLRRKFPA